MMCRGWIAYILALVFVFFAIVMLWNRYFNKGKPLEAFRIIAPPNRNAVEQLLTLQEVISQYEALIQTVNVILLKIRAILFAVLPQVHVPAIFELHKRKMKYAKYVCPIIYK